MFFWFFIKPLISWLIYFRSFWTTFDFSIKRVIMLTNRLLLIFTVFFLSRESQIHSSQTPTPVLILISSSLRLFVVLGAYEALCDDHTSYLWYCWCLSQFHAWRIIGGVGWGCKLNVFLFLWSFLLFFYNYYNCNRFCEFLCDE